MVVGIMLFLAIYWLLRLTFFVKSFNLSKLDNTKNNLSWFATVHFQWILCPCNLCTTGFASNFRLGLCQHFFCQCWISNPGPVSNSSSITTGGLFHFFIKSHNELDWPKIVLLGDSGFRIDRCPIISSFSDYACYVRKTSRCLQL